MAQRILIQVAVAIAIFSIPSPLSETSGMSTEQRELPMFTTDQQALVEFAIGRFEAQGTRASGS